MVNNNRGRNRVERPGRRKRISIDKDIEVLITSNTPHTLYYTNPRMTTAIDMQQIGDEQYITVGDLRAVLNSARKLLEGFNVIILEIMDSEHTLEDLLIYLGLEKKYEELYSLTRKQVGEQVDTYDIKDFILNAPLNAFEKTMERIDQKLRTRVMEGAVVLFKKREFGDYNKMEIISKYSKEDLFEDAKDTEFEENAYI